MKRALGIVVGMLLWAGCSQRSAETPPGPIAPPATTADAWSAQHVRHALAQLPEGYRDALVMHDVLGMEHQEIAQLKECSVGASKSQLHKARARLRALLLPRLKGENHDVTTP